MRTVDAEEVPVAGDEGAHRCHVNVTSSAGPCPACFVFLIHGDHGSCLPINGFIQDLRIQEARAQIPKNGLIRLDGAILIPHEISIFLDFN